MHKFKFFWSILFYAVFIVGNQTEAATLIELKLKEGFSISIPSDWEEIPKAVLDEGERFKRERMPDVPFTPNAYGFVRKGSENWFDLPMITVKIDNNGRISERLLDSSKKVIFKDFENILNKFDEIVKVDREATKTFFDEKNLTIWIVLKGVVDGKQIYSIGGMVLTEKGFIQVSCFCLQNEFKKYKSLFTSVVLSITPEPRLVYRKNSKLD